MNCDTVWLEVHEALPALHAQKARFYGTQEDLLANYVAASRAVRKPDEFSCWLRIFEKTQRALNMISAGSEDDNREAVDVAGIAIAAEALRRRRLTTNQQRSPGGVVRSRPEPGSSATPSFVSYGTGDC